MTFSEDNCTTLSGKFLNSTFLTVFDGKKLPEKETSFYSSKYEHLQNNTFIVKLEWGNESFCKMFKQYDHKHSLK